MKISALTKDSMSYNKLLFLPNENFVDVNIKQQQRTD